MSTRFVLFGLCCIVTVGFVSPLKLPIVCHLFKKTKEVKYNVAKVANTIQSLIEIRRNFDIDNNTYDNTSRSLSNEKVCYSPFGCFDAGEPWYSRFRPVKLPESPKDMQTTIHFYSRKEPKNPAHIPLYPEIDMRKANFDPGKKSVIIVHGFKSTQYNVWMNKLKDVYLQEVDANVMIIDWGGRPRKKLYFQIVGNTRLVGRQLAYFVNHLIMKFGALPEKFHLIGHSLGAHICSYIGKLIPGIGRLTALDPTQLGFEAFHKKTRLDKDDANFVDVVHTDATPFVPNFGFGMMAPHGHVDFYMNGGYLQPGCQDAKRRTFILLAKLAALEMEHLLYYVSCSHDRAYMYFTEALDSTKRCTFWGHKASLINVFSPTPHYPFYKLRNKWLGSFSKCNSEYCVPLGLNTDKTTLRGSFVIRTSDKPPFCIP